MFEALKKIMSLAEELGDVTKFTVSDWLTPGEYKVDIEGTAPDGMTFEFDVKLTVPVPERKEGGK